MFAKQLKTDAVFNGELFFTNKLSLLYTFFSFNCYFSCKEIRVLFTVKFGINIILPPPTCNTADSKTEKYNFKC